MKNKQNTKQVEPQKPTEKPKVVFKVGSGLQESMIKYDATIADFIDFKKFKEKHPIDQYGSMDSSYKCGALKATKTKHCAIRPDLRLVYTVDGKDPTTISVYCFVNHEDSGTGNPPKENKQKAFAKKLTNMTFTDLPPALK